MGDGSLVTKSFTVADYVVFGASLVLSMLVGVFYGFRKQKSETSREILLGRRNLGVMPVAIALVATFLSAISVLGFPAEIYMYGTMMLYYFVVYFIVFPTVAYVFLPVLYPLHLTSIYEYLELRFSRMVRIIASMMFCVKVFLYLAVVLYAPALALSSVTELSIVTAILVTGVVAAFYTALGGSNAVVWTSVLQMLFVFAGLLGVVIFGLLDLGGFGNLMRYATEGQRIQFGDFRVNPQIRHSVWSLLIGGSFTILSLFTVNQMSAQRYFSMPSLKNAQIVLILNIPINIVSFSLFALAGLIVYASYRLCDPQVIHLVSKPEQVLVYYVMDKLSVAVGLPGLFVSALYGAGLSTLSSGYTALAAVLLEDFVKPIYLRLHQNRNFRPSTGALLSKVFAGCIGIALIGVALTLTFVSPTVIQISLSVFGIIGGPLLGVFCLGLFFPFGNKYGAIAGQLVSVVLTLWLGLGAMFSGIRPVPLPLGDVTCGLNDTEVMLSLYDAASNVSTSLSPDFGTVLARNGTEGGIVEFYKISYQYYCLFGVLLSLIVGIVVSVITGFQDRESLDPVLLPWFIRKLYGFPATEDEFVSTRSNDSYLLK